jgi:hypothetical protein
MSFLVLFLVKYDSLTFHAFVCMIMLFPSFNLINHFFLSDYSLTNTVFRRILQSHYD